MSNVWMEIVEAIGNGIHAAAEEIEKNRTADTDGLLIEADTLGQLIRRARVEREVNLRELSRETGISEIRLERYERDDTFWRPTFDEVVTIKKALRIAPASVRKFL